MDKIGHLYENSISIQTADNLPLLCKKGLKLKVVKDCFDESYLHELIHYWREGICETRFDEKYKWMNDTQIQELVKIRVRAMYKKKYPNAKRWSFCK